MVEAVEAYKASDGSLHGSRLAAANYEARAMLEKCLGNPGLVNLVMEHTRCVFEATYMVLIAENQLPEYPAMFEGNDDAHRS